MTAIERLRRAAETAGAVLFAALLAVFALQVGARLAFNRPLPWTDETAVVLYIWAMFWGAALVCRDREHVAFDLVYNDLRPPARRWLAALAAILVGGPAAWALPATLDYIAFMARDHTPVLGLPYAGVFAPFALLLVALVLRNAIRLWRLLGRDWRDAL